MERPNPFTDYTRNAPVAFPNGSKVRVSHTIPERDCDYGDYHLKPGEVGTVIDGEPNVVLGMEPMILVAFPGRTEAHCYVDIQHLAPDNMTRQTVLAWCSGS